MHFMFPLMFIPFLPTEPDLCPAFEIIPYVIGEASYSTDQLSTREADGFN